ncbi:MAG: aspartate kinase, partial [Oscillospiraceae bacterium]|nr:aspartate kinase [Oscillospiraceae bacterium]
MSLIVKKFGGSSVADASGVRRVAGIIADDYSEGHDLVVVLSAQGDTTDDLIAKASEINPAPSRREMDMLLATGELASAALMAMALEKLGLPVVSLSGRQAGIRTSSEFGSARIEKIDCERIRGELDKRRIVIVAGFQGETRNGDVTT